MIMISGFSGVSLPNDFHDSRNHGQQYNNAADKQQNPEDGIILQAFDPDCKKQDTNAEEGNQQNDSQ